MWAISRIRHDSYSLLLDRLSSLGFWHITTSLPQRSLLFSLFCWFLLVIITSDIRHLQSSSLGVFSTISTFTPLVISCKLMVKVKSSCTCYWSQPRPLSQTSAWIADYLILSHGCPIGTSNLTWPQWNPWIPNSSEYLIYLPLPHFSCWKLHSSN